MTTISPDTSVAVMQAAQSQANAKAFELKSAAADAVNKKELEQLDGVAKDFEAMFIAEMMKPMFEGIKPDSTFGGGKTEEIFTGILLQEYGKLMAETGQLGIADSVKAELIRMQEAEIEPAELENTMAAQDDPLNNIISNLTTENEALNVN